MRSSLYSKTLCKHVVKPLYTGFLAASLFHRASTMITYLPALSLLAGTSSRTYQLEETLAVTQFQVSSSFVPGTPSLAIVMQNQLGSKADPSLFLRLERVSPSCDTRMSIGPTESSLISREK